MLLAVASGGQLTGWHRFYSLLYRLSFSRGFLITSAISDFKSLVQTLLSETDRVARLLDNVKPAKLQEEASSPLFRFLLSPASFFSRRSKAEAAQPTGSTGMLSGATLHGTYPGRIHALFTWGAGLLAVILLYRYVIYWLSFLGLVFRDLLNLPVFNRLDQHGSLNNFRVLEGQLLAALDGTQYYSSSNIHCPNCLRRQTSKGQTLYYHTAITPVIVCPGRSEVIALPPELIMPQDGHDKQDCERVAGKRWIDQHAKQIAPHGVTLLGDDLYSNQPFCECALKHGFNFILVCKPESHITLYERLAFWQQTQAMKEVAQRQRSGSVTKIMLYRYINDVRLRGGQDALSVNWLELTEVQAKTGEQLYYNSFITNHQISDANVADLARAGRGRWKIENENNNVLKTKGYHIEHNFGHGKRYLSAFLLSLNLLAFLFHTVLAWGDDKYALLRKTLARRQTFFDDIRALTRYMVFTSWQHMMDFMIRGLELEDELGATPDTS